MSRLSAGYGLRFGFYVVSALAFGAFFLACNSGISAASDPWKPGQVVEPSTLARELESPTNKPLLLQVGFRRLYDQGHIPGSEYCGPAFRPGGIANLKKCLASVPHDRAILIYCGCCPWQECPNIRPAFAEAKRLGFTRVRVLDIPHNFGRDWAHQGYPTEP